MSDSTTLRRRIYRVIWDLATPLFTPGSPLDRACRMLVSGAPLLASLSAEFAESALVSAGVLATDSAGGLGFAPALPTEGALMFSIRDRSRAIVDLVTEHGALSGVAPAIAQVRNVGIVLPLVHVRGRLFVVFSPADCLWFIKLGLPAVLCATAAALTPGLISRIHRDARQALIRFWRQTAASDLQRNETLPTSKLSPLGHTAASNEVIEPLLVVVNACLGTGGSAEPPGLQAQIEKLVRIEPCLSPTWPELCVWNPGADEIEVFATLQQFGLTDSLREAVLSSVEKSARVVSSLPRRIPDVDYISARAEYLAALVRAEAQDHPDEDILFRQQVFENAVERDVVRPLLAHGMAQSDPVRRLLYASLAELGKHLPRDAVFSARELSASPTMTIGERSRWFLGLLKQVAVIDKLLKQP